MASSFELWLEYVLRFSHLVAGIAWIGSSFYFIWLDSSFEAPETPRKNVEGETFMVHGGFYYKVEKRKIYPGELPKVLHWFKWEATLTWATGLVLFFFLYFLRGATLLIDPTILVLTQGQAIALALALIGGSWLVYDTVWHPSLMTSPRAKSLATGFSVLFFSALIYALTRIFSGRGAFVMTGAIFGSLMLANVWVRILPGQAKMLREAQAGQVPDFSVSLKSKTRSVHNTYFIFPVLFIMLSNHYPGVYNHPLNWLLLILIGVSGAMTRHAMVTRNPVERWTLAPAAIGLAALVYLTGAPPKLDAGSEKVEFSQVHSIVQARCQSCHSQHPTDELFKTAPKNVVFENETQLRALADKIQLHVVQARTMPLANRTGMTNAERRTVGRWLLQQGLVPSP